MWEPTGKVLAQYYIRRVALRSRGRIGSWEAMGKKRGVPANRCVEARCIALIAALISGLLIGWSVPSKAASWTPLTSLAPDFAGTMILLTDGTVMVQGGSAATGTNGPESGWMKLTPNMSGSYINGTWSTLASMSTARLYFASNVLPNGNLWVLGGEYTGNPLTANFANTGEVYNPITNSWSPIAHHPEANFGDDPSMLLPNGKILAGSISTRNTYLYDIASNTWSFAAAKVYNDRSDEEGWVKLPGNKVLTYDIFMSIATLGSYAEVYDPANNMWSSISPSDGTASGFIPQLSSNNGPNLCCGFELGPLLRLKDGRIFVIGATGHTALYTPSTNTWAAGPDIVSSSKLFGADDAPAAVMPNGHVLFAADAGPQGNTFSPPTLIFDFDPTTNTISTAAPAIPDVNLVNIPAFVTRMLMLPTGQVLFADSSRQLYAYTPDGPPDPGSRPVINNITYNGAGLFTLTGKQLTGQSAGSNYGDDVESDENFPIVRLTNATGVFYARTTNWSSVDVGGGLGLQTVDFTLHPGMTPGNYSLVVIGAGISSFPVFVNITGLEVADL